MNFILVNQMYLKRNMRKLNNMNKKAQKLLKAAKHFREIADLYEEMANLYIAEDTKENNEKITMLVGKLMIALSNIEK